MSDTDWSRRAPEPERQLDDIDLEAEREADAMFQLRGDAVMPTGGRGRTDHHHVGRRDHREARR